MIRLCLKFSKTSHVDILDSFGKPVVDKVKIDVCMKNKEIIRRRIV